MFKNERNSKFFQDRARLLMAMTKGDKSVHDGADWEKSAIESHSVEALQDGDVTAW